MTTFAELGIDNNILQGLADLGFTSPTPVQEKIIPLLIEEQPDLVGLAQTGTGKTAAFGIPLIQGTVVADRRTQALILCPTRELCVQVARDIVKMAAHVSGLQVVAVYGGASIEQQMNALRRASHIIVATPGRLNDLIRRRAVDISRIRTVVLDEADEMLQMGFQDELNAILSATPDTKNTLLFSATMPKGVATISARYMTNPIEITVGERNAGAKNVRHVYYMAQARDRYVALKRIVDIEPDIYGIIFCRTRQETQDVADKLIQDGYGADALHGELSQAQRDHVMGKFRRKNIQILVATDVAARGLDVNDLTHVINYNLPDETSNYTHRSGRTGRAGKSGTSIAIINLRERFKIREIERILKRTFEQGRIPTGREICEKQLFSLVETFKQVEVDHEQIDPLFEGISRSLADLDREELIKRFVSLEFKRFLDYYRNAPDLNASAGKNERGERKVRKTRDEKSFNGQNSHAFSRFSINVGKKDGIFPQRLIGHINDNTRGRIKIGKIQIKESSAMIEADSRYAHQVINAFNSLMINGKQVSIELSGGDQQGGQVERRTARQGSSYDNERKSFKSHKGVARKKTHGKKSSQNSHWDSPSLFVHQ